MANVERININQNAYHVNWDTVGYYIRFSEPVSGLTPANFELFRPAGSPSGAGNATGQISTVSLSPSDPSTWLIEVTNVAGDGVMGLAFLGGGAASSNGAPVGAYRIETWQGGGAYLIDNSPPAVESTTAPNPGVYKIGDLISFGVQFDESLQTGGGSGAGMDLIIGVDGGAGVTRTLGVSAGSGSSLLTWGYRVVEGDLDNDDVQVGDTLTFSGLSDAAGNPLTTILNTDFATAGVRIDGVRPMIESIERDGASPTSDASVRYVVTFKEGVNGVDAGDFIVTTSAGVRGTPTISVSETDDATYEVIVGGLDGDGTVRLDFVGGSGTNITDIAGNAIAATGGALQGQTYTIFDAPAATAVAVATGHDRTHKVGDAIEFTVTFDEVVRVTSSGADVPYIAVALDGGQTARAVYDRGSDSQELVFRYVVEQGQSDLTGLALGDLVTPGVSTLRDAAGNDTVRVLPAIDTTGVRVDGEPPRVSVARVNVDGILTVGDLLAIEVTFTEAVSIVGAPSIAVTLAPGKVVQATFQSVSGSVATFAYEIQDGDQAISPSVADAIVLNGGAIRDAAGNDAIGIGGGVVVDDVDDIRVDAVRPTVSSFNLVAPGGSQAAEIQYRLVFSEDVNGVDINDFVLNLEPGVTGGDITGFSQESPSSYLIMVTGLAGEGDVSITLKGAGADIHDGAENLYAGPNESQSYTLTDLPVVTGVAGPSNGTYGIGDELEFTVTMSRNVTVTGAPRLTITLGDNATAYATYVQTDGAKMTFRYTVVAGQVDADGIAVGAAIDLNAGTIRDAQVSENDALLSLPAVATGAVRIDGVTPTVGLTDMNAKATAFIAGEKIRLEVEYTEDVFVTGTPLIRMIQGTQGQGEGWMDASYVSGHGSPRLVFEYTVQNEDFDGDGVAINPQIVLGSGAIRDAAGNDAALNVTFAEAAGVRIDAQKPVIASVTRVGSEQTSADSVAFTVTFSEDVDDVGAGDFRTIGDGAGAATTGAITVTEVAGSGGRSYTVTVDGVSGDGALFLSFTPTAQIFDVAGNLFVAQAPANAQGYVIDNTAPALTLDPIATDDVISANETSGLTISGTTEAGGAVTVSLGGATRAAVVTPAQGAPATWSYTVSGDDLRAMGAGAEPITVTATDAAGNIATQTRTISVDAAAVPAPPPSEPNPPAPSTPPVIAPDQVPDKAGVAIGVELNSAKATSPTVTLPDGRVVQNPLYTTAQAAAQIQADLAAGRITANQAVEQIVDLSLPTTGVAHDVYKFFTGGPPTAQGMRYLIDSADNASDLTDGYYAMFSVENRFINFAVNLGKVGEGRSVFESKYGALSFGEAVARAYDEVIGLDNAQAAGFDVEAALLYIQSQRGYFEALGGDAIGAKAAMVGYVISLGGAFRVGDYYDALQDHVVESIIGTSGAAAAWDLV